MQKRPRIWLVWVQKTLPPKSLFWDFGGSSDPPPPRKGFNSNSISTFLVIAGDPEITRIVEIIHDRGPFQESLDPPNPRIPPNPHQTIPTKHMISRTGRALRKSRNHQKCPFSQQKCAFPGIPGSSKSQNPSHSWRSPPSSK